MKRIFIVQNTPLNEPLPLSVYLTGLISNLKKDKNYEINLIVGKSKVIPKEIKKACNKIYELSSSTYSIKDNIKFSFKVRSILRKENKDKRINIVHCLYPNSSLLGGVLFKIFNNKSAELIYDLRSPWIEMSIERGHVKKGLFLYKKILYTEEKTLCKFVDKFMFITKGLKEHYLKTFISQKNPKVYVSPSGVDLKIFRKTKSNIRKKYGIKKDEILVGSVGGITNERKPWEILELFSRVIKQNKEVKIILIGGRDNNLSELKELAKKLNIQNNVILTGNILHKEMPKYISSFNFGLCHLPDNFVHQNNFSLKILEYLACGVPVLASKLKSNVEIAKQLKGVYIFENSSEIIKIIHKKEIPPLPPKNLIDYSWPSLIKNYEKMWTEI